jgi:hypothetical protein
LVSAPFAHRRLDHSGSLRTLNETSGTLALLPHVHHTPAYIRARPGPGSARCLDVDESSAQFQIPLRPFVSRSRRRVLCCAVLWCVLVIDIHRRIACVPLLRYSATRLALPDFHQHSQQSASARFNTRSPHFAAFFHASSQHPFFSADQSRKSSHSTAAAVHARLPHFRLPTHITTCSGQ